MERLKAVESVLSLRRKSRLKERMATKHTETDNDSIFRGVSPPRENVSSIYMSDKSINEACKECPQIKSLLRRAQFDEGAKRGLEMNAVHYISSLIECVETYDEHVDYQASISNSLQKIADSSGRRADLYEEMSAGYAKTLKHVVETIPEIVNAAVNRIVSDLINQLNKTGVLTKGIGLEQRESVEFLRPIRVDLNNMNVTGEIELVDTPKLTLYAVSNTSLLIKTEEALNANRESGILEFKEGFHQDPLSKEATGAWCEIIKDIVAMANTNGGFILLGLRNDGSVSEVDVAPFVSIDPAKITDKIYSYTGAHFDGFHLSSEYKDGKLIAVLQIEEAENILVFINPGNYIDSHGKQKSAFTVGATYVRHGAKSEPCTAEDMHKIVSRKVEARVSKMLAGSNQGFISASDDSNPTEPLEHKQGKRKATDDSEAS